MTDDIFDDIFTDAQKKRQNELWANVSKHLETATAICWDGCHKIYVLMDDQQLAKQRKNGYDPIITRAVAEPSDMLNYLKNWYEVSCFLKFINAVTTVEEDPNRGYTNLIEQGEEAFDPDLEDEEASII